MYRPSAFAMDDPDAIGALIAEHPLATLIVSDADGGLDAEHVPLTFRPPSGGDAPDGRLVGHVARGNPLVRRIGGTGVPALAIFHGPQAYITPSWYPTKRETGKAVPTWNYAVVHVHGNLRAIDDSAWLLEQVTELTRSREEGRAEPWAVGDAPADYIDAMSRGIVGVELTISRMIGKSKMSQNQPEGNRRGVAAGLRADAEVAAADGRQDGREAVARSVWGERDGDG